MAPRPPPPADAREPERAEPDATDRSHLFERFFVHALDLLCIADIDGFIRVVNPAWERVLGWTPEELTARPYLELVHPDDIAATVEAAGALARGETVLRFINRYRCKDGGYRRLEWCSVVPTGEGLVYATVRDVTEASRDAVHRAEIEVIAGVGSWEIDLDLGTVYWSPLTHTIHETDPATFRPRLDDALQFFSPEGQAELRPAIERLMTSGTPYDLELPFITARGRRLWVRATAAVEIRGGRVTRAFGTVQDVTERRAAAEALRLSEERHRLAQVATGVGIIDWDIAAGTLIWDSYCRRMLGLIGEARTTSFDEWRQGVHPDDRARVDEVFAATLREGRSFDVEFRHRSTTSAWPWLRARGDVVARGDDGGPLRAVGTLMDIGERKRQEQALVAAHNRLQATLAAIPDVLFEFDADGRFLSYHSGLPDLLAMPPERFLGRRLEEVMPPEHAALARAAMREAAERGRASGQQYGLELADGMHWFELSVSRRPAEDPQAPPGFVMLTRDITLRHEAEVALKVAREKAEQASLAKSRFLANMSHEIRTPLNGLLGMAEVLDRALASPSHRRMLAVIRESGEVLLNIINDVLDMSKIEAGKLTIEQIVFQPLELVRKIESLHTLKATERGISLSILTTLGAERPRLGDPHRILQILHNLVSNAIKFTEQGSVTVTIHCDPRKPFRVEVRDTGIGMTEEQLSRVFEDFEQADSGITRRFGGTGLGMSIVRRLVTLMHGGITIESHPGEGTRVFVELPLDEPERLPELAADVEEPAAEGLAGLRVLAVDDNEINRTVLAAMLDELSTATTMVSSGRAAVDCVAAATFDVVLLDISMPGMDGVETLQAIRAVEAAQGRAPCVAVAVTANAFQQQVVEYLRAGFDAHIAKPIRPKLLRSTLVAVLSERAGRR